MASPLITTNIQRHENFTSHADEALVIKMGWREWGGLEKEIC